MSYITLNINFNDNFIVKEKNIEKKISIKKVKNFF